jgi:hypothetical protein
LDRALQRGGVQFGEGAATMLDVLILTRSILRR